MGSSSGLFRWDVRGITNLPYDAAGNIASYFQDPLGSARVVAGPSGTLAESDYYPFGGERVISSTLAPGNKYQFTGMERDAESGLDHTLYRQYSSSLGRWLSRDPVRGCVKNPQELNLYAYVLNNPTNFIDPLGLQCSDVSVVNGQFTIGCTSEAPAPGGIGGAGRTGTSESPSSIPLIFARGMQLEGGGGGTNPCDFMSLPEYPNWAKACDQKPTRKACLTCCKNNEVNLKTLCTAFFPFQEICINCITKQAINCENNCPKK